MGSEQRPGEVRDHAQEREAERMRAGDHQPWRRPGRGDTPCETGGGKRKQLSDGEQNWTRYVVGWSRRFRWPEG